MSQGSGAATYARVTTYIDGFNLYYGMREGGLSHRYWLDLRLLSLRLLGPGQKLAGVKYFTSRISAPPDKRKRQTTFLEALTAHCGIVPIEGHFLGKTVDCHDCGRTWPDHEEKMTDVNIATELLTDAFQGRYDAAVIVSGDSDLVPPIRAIRRLFPALRVLVAFPPNRDSAHLRQTADGFVRITDAMLAACQLPDEVTKADGFVLKRPASWGPPAAGGTP